MTVKAAVIVSGQVRRNSPVASNLAILRELDPWVCVSVWRKRGLKRTGWLSLVQVSRVLGEPIALAYPRELIGNSDVLFNYLPSFRAELDRFAGALPLVTEADFTTVSDCIEVEDEAEVAIRRTDAIGRVSTERLLYKLARGLRLIERQEAVQGWKFSHVIRLRPDCSISSLDAIDENLVYIDGARNLTTLDKPLLPSDNFIIAPRDDFFSLVDGAYGDFIADGSIDIHSLLGAQLEESRNRVRVLSGMEITDDQWPSDLFVQCLASQVAVHPDDEMGRSFLSNIIANQHLADGRPLEAIECLEQISAQFAQAPGVTATRARALSAAGREEEAIALAVVTEEAIKAAGDSSFYPLHRYLIPLLKAAQAAPQ